MSTAGAAGGGAAPSGEPVEQPIKVGQRNCLVDFYIQYSVHMFVPRMGGSVPMVGHCKREAACQRMGTVNGRQCANGCSLYKGGSVPTDELSTEIRLSGHFFTQLIR